ncbi:glycosyltransferase family 39 protein [uncultured Roseibium sp.]|uniref:glycosyltransferase family 39 protein n=1 Tax=uncultured Roseibium sp. TaxID=1936171 RepID=UPI002632B4E0|nr:glycosyltransferase family 39 protein [uncultured Roseibium sp.]
MQRAEKHFPKNIATAILLTAILLIAAVLRFHNLDRTSLWYDEAVSWSQSNGSITELLTLVASDNYPPLHNIVLWLTMPVLGDSETALRLPSASLGLLSVWLVYLIGKQLQGREAGLLAAALLAISPLHIWYSTEARMYALLAACGLAFLLAVLKVLQRPSVFWFTTLVFTGACFLYSHIYALFGFASAGAVCGTVALFEIHRTRKPLKSNAFVASLAMGISTALFLPWLYLLFERARSVADEGFWIAYPNLQFLETLVFGLSSSLMLFWLLVGLALTGAALAFFKPISKQSTPPTSKQAVLVCLAYSIGPLLLAYLYSVLLQPILFDRYLIAAWPGLIVLAAMGATRQAPRIASVALVGAALYLTFPQLNFTLTNKIRPEWRTIAAFLEENRAPEDKLLLYKGFSAPVLSYYLRGENQFEAVENVEDLSALTKSEHAGKTWLLLVHSNEEETAAAKKLFFDGKNETAAKAFGWGASGLTLLRSDAAQQN